ncbi:hypothetical protein E4T66_02435 [Sinimarinibacterium sp. CAU 1509]|uniref:acetoacetate decarboxylase family protein n=1 Tax=Sinimarinibacterium sp. CAU 1509 TaxID=2562283 RepID=UPI0010AC9319|nr:acetoacetate decarboxylase family protein [Sinimarinibacterium sp. CAU 1509]TJY65102.1 hypothetical protein E4T66_02435 [Sinimarinibacterium sp. CAU 1509]
MNAKHNDPFFQVPQQSQATSAGPAKLPILYFDATEAQAYFLCDRDKVEQTLKGTGLSPGLVIGSKAVVGLVFFEYRDTSIGPYNEVGLAVPVLQQPHHATVWTWREPLTSVADPHRNLAFHVLHLPVTTQAANAAGRELWGLPKFVTEIPFNCSRSHFNSSVLDPGDGSEIVTLFGKPGLGMPVPTLDLLLFSSVGDKHLRTSVNARGHTRGLLPGSVRLHIGASKHPMATTLRTLGLQDASPAMLAFTPDFQSRLNAGIAEKGRSSTVPANKPARA